MAEHDTQLAEWRRLLERFANWGDGKHPMCAEARTALSAPAPAATVFTPRALEAGGVVHDAAPAQDTMTGEPPEIPSSWGCIGHSIGYYRPLVQEVPDTQAAAQVGRDEREGNQLAALRERHHQLHTATQRFHRLAVSLGYDGITDALDALRDLGRLAQAAAPAAKPAPAEDAGLHDVAAQILAAHKDGHDIGHLVGLLEETLCGGPRLDWSDAQPEGSVG